MVVEELKATFTFTSTVTEIHEMGEALTQF